MNVKARIPEGGAIVNDEETNAEEYSATMLKAQGGEYRRFVRHVVETLNPPLGSKVLEIGPGPGWITVWLAQARPDLQIDGLEPSPDMRQQAEKTAEKEGVGDRVRFFAGFVEQMEHLSPQSYDIVISNGSLHHWVDPVQGFQGIAKVLKPGGKVFIQDGRRDLGLRAKFIVYVLGRLMAGKNWKFWKSSIDAGYTPVELRDILQQAQLNNWGVSSNFMEVSITT